MGVPQRAFDELVNFIAAGSTPAQVAGFQASEATRRRVNKLIAAEEASGLTPDEASELDHYLTIEHVMRGAEARVRELLRGE